MNTSPTYYKLSPRTKLEAISDKHLAIVKQIKSRIIMKDALKIVDSALMIREKEPEIKVSLLCNDNICSKSIQYLKEHRIDIIT